MAKATGGGGSVTLAGTSLPFTTLTPSVAKEHDDESDSTNYDQTSQLVHKAQLAVSTQTTFKLEGKVDVALIPPTLVPYLYTNPGAVACVVKYNTGTIFGHGNVDVQDFESTIDPMKTLTYSATFISNGVWVANS